MWRKFSHVVPIAALLLFATAAHAQFEAGNWELTLAGTGANDQDFRTYDLAVQGGVGYFLTNQLEIGARQVLTSSDGGSAWGGSTRAAIDWHFDLGRWQPFVGGSLGYAYGDNVSDSWLAGFETGVKFFVNTTTFIGVVAGYDFNLEEGLDEGAFQYGLAVGVKF